MPDKLAERLGITPQAVDAGETYVEVNGSRFHVAGIFEADSLAALRDLDGRDVLPFDMERVANVDETKDNQFLVPEDSPRVAPRSGTMAARSAPCRRISRRR